MKKGFIEAREEYKSALAKQEALLAEHRERLAAFQAAHARLDSDTEDAVGDVLQNAILRETKKVESIEATINNLRRELKTRLSVTPPYLAM